MPSRLQPDKIHRCAQTGRSPPSRSACGMGKFRETAGRWFAQQRAYATRASAVRTLLRLPCRRLLLASCSTGRSLRLQPALRPLCSHYPSQVDELVMAGEVTAIKSVEEFHEAASTTCPTMCNAADASRSDQRRQRLHHRLLGDLVRPLQCVDPPESARAGGRSAYGATCGPQR